MSDFNELPILNWCNYVFIESAPLHLVIPSTVASGTHAYTFAVILPYGIAILYRLCPVSYTLWAMHYNPVITMVTGTHLLEK